MKSKAAKVIFLVSFIPWALVLLYGMYCAFFGVDFFETCYGWDGFLVGIMIAGGLMCVAPILPVCLVYEICYILHNKVPMLRKVSTKKFFISALVLCVITAGGVLLYGFRYEVEAMVQKASAKQMLKKAEEKIVSNKSTVNVGGIFGIEECIYEMIFVDYDKHQVGVLQSGLDEFRKFTLKETTEGSDVIRRMKRDYYIQVMVPLSAPGKYLFSFYSEPESPQRTSCLLLEMENGEYYYVIDIKERGTEYESYLGLRNSMYYVGDGVHFTDLEIE